MKITREEFLEIGRRVPDKQIRTNAARRETVILDAEGNTVAWAFYPRFRPTTYGRNRSAEERKEDGYGDGS